MPAHLERPAVHPLNFSAQQDADNDKDAQLPTARPIASTVLITNQGRVTPQAVSRRLSHLGGPGSIQGLVMRDLRFTCGTGPGFLRLFQFPLTILSVVTTPY
jgi:hypothetical protein